MYIHIYVFNIIEFSPISITTLLQRLNPISLPLRKITDKFAVMHTLLFSLV